jgi:hypothetical protein
VGASFMSSAGADALLLCVALAFEKTAGGSPIPGYKPTVNADDMSVL